MVLPDMDNILVESSPDPPVAHANTLEQLMGMVTVYDET